MFGFIKNKERREGGPKKQTKFVAWVGHLGGRGEEIEQIHEGHDGPPFQDIIIHIII